MNTNDYPCCWGPSNTVNKQKNVPSITGTPATGVVIDIQSSANNSTFTTNATFTTTTQKSMLSETTTPYVGPYIRANVINLDGATEVNFSVIVNKI